MKVILAAAVTASVLIVPQPTAPLHTAAGAEQSYLNLSHATTGGRTLRFDELADAVAAEGATGGPSGGVQQTAYVVPEGATGGPSGEPDQSS